MTKLITPELQCSSCL